MKTGGPMTYDVIVAGGGLAGTFAAVAAARRGCRVALFEPGGFLGGVATAAMVTVFMGYHVVDEQAEDGMSPLVKGCFEEMISRLREEGGALDVWHFDDLILRTVLDDMVTESGVDVFFHSLVTSANIAEGRIRSISFAGKSGLCEATAMLFIDSSGDADLAFRAGARFEVGDGAGRIQPMTATFQMAGVDTARVPPPKERSRIYREAFERGDVAEDLGGVGMFATPRPGVFLFNTTHVYNLSGTDTLELSRAEMIGRGQTRRVVRALQQFMPGFENAWLVKMGTKIGVRETRRLRGLYTLTAGDVLEARHFPDGIARCSYEIDIHDPKGGGNRSVPLKRGTFYEIPYRCLLPADGPRNVIVACRAISATHEAHGSLRIMATTSAMGEAAGVAASRALAAGGDFHQIDGSALKRLLLEAQIMGSPLP